jgi:hypothetical protein
LLAKDLLFGEARMDHPKKNVLSSDLMWGFEDAESQSCINFYFPRNSLPTYAAIARDPNQSAVPDENNKATPEIKYCTFNRLGGCRFGSKCRYSHDNPPPSVDVGELNDVAVAQTFSINMPSVECGICMENPRVFGILSNCDCVFCLDCIRNWRNDGVQVAKEATQVRYMYNSYRKLYFAETLYFKRL